MEEERALANALQGRAEEKQQLRTATPGSAVRCQASQTHTEHQKVHQRSQHLPGGDEIQGVLFSSFYTSIILVLHGNHLLLLQLIKSTTNNPLPVPVSIEN